MAYLTDQSLDISLYFPFDRSKRHSGCINGLGTLENNLSIVMPWSGSSARAPVIVCIEAGLRSLVEQQQFIYKQFHDLMRTLSFSWEVCIYANSNNCHKKSVRSRRSLN